MLELLIILFMTISYYVIYKINRKKELKKYWLCKWQVFILKEKYYDWHAKEYIIIDKIKNWKVFYRTKSNINPFVSLFTEHHRNIINDFKKILEDYEVY